MTTLASRRRTREPLQPTAGGERHAMADDNPARRVHRMTIGVSQVDADTGERVEVIPPRTVACSWLDIPAQPVKYPPCKCPRCREA